MVDVLPLLSCAEAAAFEKRILPDEAAVEDAMRRAGSALAAAVLMDFPVWRPWPEEARVLILAGKGNNAGDALIAAQHLVERMPGTRVSLLWAYGMDSLKPSLARLRRALHERMRDRLDEYSWNDDTGEALARGCFDVTLDGVQGMGFRPPWRGPGAAMIRWANEHRDRLGFRVAVDLPSGMGDESADVVFVADVSYATGSVKAPVLASGAVAQSGQVSYLDLGFFKEGADVEEGRDVVVTPAVLRRIGALRAADSDKRDYGHVVLAGGSARYPGALLMSTQAALRAGAGLVTAALPAPVAPGLAGSVPEAMWKPLPAHGTGAFSQAAVESLSDILGKRSVAVIGPGMVVDPANGSFVARVLRELEVPVVLDAGALSTDLPDILKQRPSGYPPVVLTPHQGEFNRLLGRGGDYEREWLVAFCREHRVTVVLKGPVTRICGGAAVYHCPVGNAVLARGGSGDILAGILAARLAVQLKNPLRAAMEAVQWQGAAAQWLARERGQVAVRTTELLDYLGPALRGG